MGKQNSHKVKCIEPNHSKAIKFKLKPQSKAKWFFNTPPDSIYMYKNIQIASQYIKIFRKKRALLYDVELIDFYFHIVLRKEIVVITYILLPYNKPKTLRNARPSVTPKKLLFLLQYEFISILIPKTNVTFIYSTVYIYEYVMGLLGNILQNNK